MRLGRGLAVPRVSRSGMVTARWSNDGGAQRDEVEGRRGEVEERAMRRDNTVVEASLKNSILREIA